MMKRKEGSASGYLAEREPFITSPGLPWRELSLVDGAEARMVEKSDKMVIGVVIR